MGYDGDGCFKSSAATPEQSAIWWTPELKLGSSCSSRRACPGVGVYISSAASQVVSPTPVILSSPVGIKHHLNSSINISVWKRSGIRVIRIQVVNLERLHCKEKADIYKILHAIVQKCSYFKIQVYLSYTGETYIADTTNYLHATKLPCMPHTWMVVIHDPTHTSFIESPN